MVDENYINRLKELVQIKGEELTDEQRAMSDVNSKSFKVYADGMSQHVISKDLDDVVPMHGEKALTVIYKVMKSGGLMKGRNEELEGATCSHDQFLHWTARLMHNVELGPQPVQQAVSQQEKVPQDIKTNAIKADSQLPDSTMQLLSILKGLETKKVNDEWRITINKLYEGPDSPSPNGYRGKS